MTSGTLNRTTDDVAKVRAKFIDTNKRRFGLRDGGVGPVARCQTHQPTQAAGPSEGVGPRVRIRLAPAARWYGAGDEEMAPSSLWLTDGVP
jgi:hypothetical protein